MASAQNNNPQKDQDRYNELKTMRMKELKKLLKQLISNNKSLQSKYKALTEKKHFINAIIQLEKQQKNQQPDKPKSSTDDDNKDNDDDNKDNDDDNKDNNDDIKASPDDTSCVSVAACKYFGRLKVILSNYDGITIDDTINTKDVINDFHHMLLNHNTDKDIKDIINILGKCDITKCDIIKRHHNDDDNDNDDDDNKVETIHTVVCRGVINKIHCHFMHPFDLGYRSSTIEKIQLNSISNNQKGKPKNDDNSDNKQNDDDKIKLIKQTQKAANVYKSSNKFCTENLEPDDDIDDDPKLDKLFNQYYSYGEIFYYWDYYKNNTDYDYFNSGYKYCDRYVPPKYSSLKEELLQNGIKTIPPNSNTKIPIALTQPQWMQVYIRTYLHASIFSKRLFARPFNKLTATQYGNHTKFGIGEYQEISLEHLIAVKVYCDYTLYQREFTKTFRRETTKSHSNQPKDDPIARVAESVEFVRRITSDEAYKNVEDLIDKIYVGRDISNKYKLQKERNSNFHYLSKLIIEAVNVYYEYDSYLQKFNENMPQIFYHGINTDKFKFESMKVYMFQPFSTTISKHIALDFAAKDGICLKLTPDNEVVRAFNCQWLSKYPYEDEYLFMNTVGCINIINIEFIKTTPGQLNNPKLYQALSILETLTNESGSSMQVLDRIKYKDIDQNEINDSWNTIKSYVSNIIEHVIYMNTKKKSKSLINQWGYKEQKFITNFQYFNYLLLNICNKKQWSHIDYNLLNDINKFYGFLKNYFIRKDCEMINLDILSTLYPNLKVCIPFNMPLTIVSNTKNIDYVLNWSANISKAFPWLIFNVNDSPTETQRKHIQNKYKQHFKKDFMNAPDDNKQPDLNNTVNKPVATKSKWYITELPVDSSTKSFLDLEKFNIAGEWLDLTKYFICFSYKVTMMEIFLKLKFK